MENKQKLEDYVREKLYLLRDYTQNDISEPDGDDYLRLFNYTSAEDEAEVKSLLDTIEKSFERLYEIQDEYYSYQKGEFMKEKKLSEFLKENNIYDSFVEYSVESFLKCLDWYKVFKSENNTISLGNIFIWEDTKEGQNYWRNLKSNLPEPIEYDMDEIIFAEVERRYYGKCIFIREMG